MNTEYQRREAETSEVQNQIDALVKSCGQMVAADFIPRPEFIWSSSIRLRDLSHVAQVCIAALWKTFPAERIDFGAAPRRGAGGLIEP